jgi:hypothetical protein
MVLDENKTYVTQIHKFQMCTSQEKTMASFFVSRSRQQLLLANKEIDIALRDI